MKVTDVVRYKHAPLKGIAILAGQHTPEGDYFVGKNFRGKKEPVLHASPGRSAEVIGNCPELGHSHSIVAHSTGLYVAGQYGLFHSLDTGRSWKPIRVGGEETRAARGLATMPDGTIWLGFEDKMASSTDGKTWTIIKLPRGATGGRPLAMDGALYFLGEKTIGRWNGTTFDTVRVGKGKVTGLARTSAGVFLAVSEEQVLRATGNAGELPTTWTAGKSPIGADYHHEGCCIVGDSAIVVGDRKVMSTTDGKSFEVLAELAVRIEGVIPSAGGAWVVASKTVDEAGLLSWIGDAPSAAGKADKTSKAGKTSAPPEEATVDAPRPRARSAPRPKATKSVPRTMTASDAFAELKLGRFLQAPASAFDTKQVFHVYDGNVVADRFEPPGPSVRPHSVIVRGDLDVEGLEWAVDDAVSVLIVEGKLRARYVWLYGSPQVRIAGGVDVEDVIAGSGGGQFEVVAGGIQARAVLQQHEFTMFTRKGKIEALVVGDEDHVDEVAYAPDDIGLAELLVAQTFVDDDDSEWDALAVRKLLRASKDVLRTRLPPRGKDRKGR